MMPRYFFNTDNHTVEKDDTGTVLADAAQARKQAVVFAGAMLRDDPDLVWDGFEFCVNVTNERGEAVVNVLVRAEDHEGV